MKKIFFAIILILVMMISMVACNNSSTTENSTDVSFEASTEATPKVPELSDTFNETALQFIEKYSTGTSKELENLAEEIILYSKGFRDDLYNYLNYSEKSVEKIENVEVWIHNYSNGGDIGCVSYDGQTPFFNYDHNPIILAAGVLGDKYPDNVTLAEARIAAYVLIHMDSEEVDCCIVTSESGERSYDFTFKNESFKEKSREILVNLE